LIKGSEEESVLAIGSHGNVLALFLHYFTPGYNRADSEKILNPQRIDGEYLWDSSFRVPRLKEIATCHSKNTDEELNKITSFQALTFLKCRT
jgi:hypothetical protein